MPTHKSQSNPQLMEAEIVDVTQEVCTGRIMEVRTEFFLLIRANTQSNNPEDVFIRIEPGV